MKKKVFLVLVLVLAIVLVTVLGGYALAAAGIQVLDHNFTITVEPIESQVMEISSLVIGPGNSVTVRYMINNRSPRTDYPIVAEQATNIKSTWKLDNVLYSPGSSFIIRHLQTMELRITFYPDSDAGEIPVNIKIYRLSGEKG